jgi:putative peptidoglycan lipid II flippase
MSAAGRSIATAAVLIMLGNVASRVLGLVREQLIAALFGTTAAASVFTAASRVPTMVYDLLIGGALTAALVPVFSEYAAREEQAKEAKEAEEAEGTGWAEGAEGGGRAEGAGGPRRDSELGRLAGAVLGLALLVLLPVVVLLMLLARPLMSVLGVGFAPEWQEQGILLVRVALPAVLLMGVAAVLMGVLYALHRVTLPSFSAAIYNALIILCGLALSPWLGVTSLVVGILVGAAGQTLLQVPGLRRASIRLSFDLSHPGVRRIARLYLPVAGGLLVSAGVVALDTRLASTTGEGTLAAMRYATTLIQLPLGLVATALSFATLPVLSRYGASGAAEAGFRRTLANGIKAALLLVVPAMVGLIVLREPIVRLLFQRGAFGPEGAAQTALALLVYAPQLPFVAVDQLLIAAFYALQNTRLPVLVGVAGAGLYALVALGTVERLGMAGLVLANTVQNSAHAVILLICLRRVTGPQQADGLWAAAGRIALAGGLMALVVAVAQQLLPAPHDVYPLAAYLLVLSAAAGGVYLATLAALRSGELAYAVAIVRARIGGGT